MRRKKRNFSTDENLAKKMYEPKDVQADDPLSRGLFETHEQVSDLYMEGTNEPSEHRKRKN